MRRTPQGLRKRAGLGVANATVGDLLHGLPYLTVACHPSVGQPGSPTHSPA
jgi:hypothetical protein